MNYINIDNEYLKVQIARIEQALDILRKNQRNLSAAMDTNFSTSQYARLGRIITEYIVIKVAALVDPRRSTFSLIHLRNSRVNAVCKKYTKMLNTMTENRKRAFGHHERNFIQTKEIMQASDLLDLPLSNFLDEVKKEL